VLSKLNDKNKRYYIFFDEIQLLDEFQSSIAELYEYPNYDIYITGSNSKLYSSSLATLLTGRTVQINVFPLSFKEYYSFMNKNFSTSVKDA
jgi:predicted AAA+ superfamily ATPase